MSTIAPPSSPMMSVPYTAEEALLSSIPGIPDAPDDIPDPPVPSGTVETSPPPALPVAIPDALLPLAHGFCQYLQARLHGIIAEEHHHWMSGFDGALVHIRTHMQEVLTANEHAQYTLGDALAKIHEHGANFVHAKADPYTAVIDARTPHGFLLRLTIEKGTSGELIEELGRLEGWLVANGYTVAEVSA